jgi:transposase InsO family protein
MDCRGARREDLAEHSRRPNHAPRQTAPALETAVLAEKAAHPSWGGRKLHHWLRQRGVDPVPAPSTIEKILRRYGWMPQAPGSVPLTRFDAAAPHALWQLDFRGWHPLRDGQVHPLTVLDDHSRFLLDVRCLGTQTLAAVQPVLTALFQRYGLPWAILCDQGPLRHKPGRWPHPL